MYTDALKTPHRTFKHANKQKHIHSSLVCHVRCGTYGSFRFIWNLLWGSLATSFVFLSIKNKCAFYFPSDNGLYSRKVQNGNPGQVKYGKTTGKSREQRIGALFCRAKGECGRAVKDKI